jgi:hypothetical protein
VSAGIITQNSIFGYPRTGYAYRPWWSFWFRWAILDRAFENRGDPATMVRYPEGSTPEPLTGVAIPNDELALQLGEDIRSGATVAIPSGVYISELDGKPSAVREWDIEFLKEGIDFEPFKETFADLDVMKLRSLWIPEQTFLEGRGGTSSRNVASEMGSHFVEQQSLLAYEIRDTLNRWVIPQFLATNFAEFIANGGTANMVVKGFADQDIEFTQQIIQLIGQQEAGQRELLKLVDLEKVLEDSGTPLLSFARQQAREAQLIQEQQAALEGPPAGAAVEPVPGQQVGVVPTGTGFSYMQPQDRLVVTLAEPGQEFMDMLPDSKHYRDTSIRVHARGLWNAWRNAYSGLYNEAYQVLVNIAPEQSATDALTEHFAEMDLSEFDLTFDRTRDVYARVARRASQIEGRSAGLQDRAPEVRIEDWTQQRMSYMTDSITNTVEEMREFCSRMASEGMTDPKEIAREMRANFEGFPEWKADRLARTEIREAYNAGTLLTAETSERPQVMALDTDPERDGKLFRVEDALRERDHPNGTLGWQIVPVELSVKHVYVPDESEQLGSFDPETNTIELAFSASPQDQREFVKAVVMSLCP